MINFVSFFALHPIFSFRVFLLPFAICPFVQCLLTRTFFDSRSFTLFSFLFPYFRFYLCPTTLLVYAISFDAFVILPRPSSFPFVPLFIGTKEYACPSLYVYQAFRSILTRKATVRPAKETSILKKRKSRDRLVQETHDGHVGNHVHPTVDRRSS